MAGSNKLRSVNFLPKLLIETATIGVPPPCSFSVLGAVAFCDISGFTSLTTDYAKRGPPGIEDLGKLLNTHYEELISTMIRHGGDVIAIIGDAALVLFADSPTLHQYASSTPSGSESSNLLADGPLSPLSEQTTLTFHCSRAVDACLDALSSGKSGLPMHIGITCGNMDALHVGGGHGKSQFLLVGPPLKQLQKVVDAARSGTLCVTQPVYSLLSSTAGGVYGRGLIPTKMSSNNWMLSRSDLSGRQHQFSQMRAPQQDSSYGEVDPRYDRLLSNYLCDSVVGRFLGFGNSESASGVDWLAEWRRLTVIFVKLHVSEEMSSEDLLGTINECFMAIQGAVVAHDGTLLHAFNDDKGIIAILVFGLPLKAHENDPTRAVACTLSLHSDLKRRGAKCSMGMTTGHVFCGCLGSPLRKDFTVLGSLVNLAARILSAVPAECEVPILCDESTKEACMLSYTFSDPIYTTAKGFKGLVATYRPMSDKPTMVASILSQEKQANVLVGRDRELERIESAIEEWTHGYSRVVFISGDAGIGKTMLMSVAMSHLSDHATKTPHHKQAIFHLKGDPFVASDFHGWAGVVSQAVTFLLSENGDEFSSPSHIPNQQLSTQITESFLRFLFAYRFPSLFPFLSLLNPLLHLTFPETQECQALASEARPPILFDICHCILSAALSIAPICICVEDAHVLDPSSWQFASRLARECFQQRRQKRETNIHSKNGTPAPPPPPFSETSKSVTPEPQNNNLPISPDMLPPPGSLSFFSPPPSYQPSRPHSPSQLFPASSFFGGNNVDRSNPASQVHLTGSGAHLTAPTPALEYMNSNARLLGGERDGHSCAGASSRNEDMLTEAEDSESSSQHASSSQQQQQNSTNSSGGENAMLFILTARSQKKDLRDEEGYWSFLSASDEICLLELSPLEQRDVGRLVKSLIPGVHDVSDEVSFLVHQRSQGNTLFIKELSLSLFQNHVLAVDDEGCCSFSPGFSKRYSVADVSDFEEIPQSIHDLVRSRVDALSADQQLLIKVASVFGERFTLEALASVHPSHPTQREAMDCIQEIAAVGLLEVGAEGNVSFNHQLTQEVTYSLLIPSQKLELHKKVAQLLESTKLGGGAQPASSTSTLNPPPQPSSRRSSFSSFSFSQSSQPLPTSVSVLNSSTHHQHPQPGGQQPQQTLTPSAGMLIDPSSPTSSSSLHQNTTTNGHPPFSPHLPGQILHTSSNSNSNDAFANQNQKGDGNGTNGQVLAASDLANDEEILPALAHHWSRGGVPEKARLYLARLAVNAHSNYHNREAIRWFKLLLEQEDQCSEKSDRMVLARWYTCLGEAYYFISKYPLANEWLIRALQRTSFEHPATSISTKWRILKEVIPQFWRRWTGKRPKTRAENEQILLQIRILKSLVISLHLALEADSALYYALLGTNIAESTAGATSSACVFYSFMAQLLGVQSRDWADRYTDLAMRSATTELDRMKVIQSVSAFLVWTSDPRALKEIDAGISIASSRHCLLELTRLHWIGIEHCSLHGLLSNQSSMVSSMLEIPSDDGLTNILAVVAAARLCLMSDDRPTFVVHIRRLIFELYEQRNAFLICQILAPLLASQLIHRDIHWPLPTSPHLNLHDIDALIRFSSPSDPDSFIPTATASVSTSVVPSRRRSVSHVAQHANSSSSSSDLLLFSSGGASRHSSATRPSGSSGTTTTIITSSILGHASSEPSHSDTVALSSPSTSEKALLSCVESAKSHGHGEDHVEKKKSGEHHENEEGDESGGPVPPRRRSTIVRLVSTSDPTNFLIGVPVTGHILELVSAANYVAPANPQSMGIFDSLQIVLELSLLHGLPISKKIVKNILKHFERVSQYMTVCKPMFMIWCSHRKLQKDSKNSAAFSELHEAGALAAQHKLPFQEAFANFIISRALRNLISGTNQKRFTGKQIQKITKCYPPFEDECNDRMEKAKNLFEQSGHLFHAKMIFDML